MGRVSAAIVVWIGPHGVVFVQAADWPVADAQDGVLAQGAVREDDAGAHPGFTVLGRIHMEPEADKLLAAYLSKIHGCTSCVLPFKRLRELAGMWLPPAAWELATWWTDPEGWSASPAARACQAAGWRLESVETSAQLVRFTRTEGADDASTARR